MRGMKIDDFCLRRVFSPFGHGVTVQHQASPHDVVFLHEPGAGIALFVQQYQHQYYWQREVLSTSNGPIPQNCCYSQGFYWQEARVPYDISVHKPIVLSSIVLDLCHVCAFSGWEKRFRWLFLSPSKRTEQLVFRRAHDTRVDGC